MFLERNLESSQVPVQGRHMSYRELDPVLCPKEVEGGGSWWTWP